MTAPDKIWGLVLAGGKSTADATSFSMTAKQGAKDFGVLSNPYLLEKAECTEYNLSCTIENGTWSYEEDTVMTMAATGGTYYGYVVNGMLSRDLSLRRGVTYSFDVDAPGHPFILTTRGGADAGELDQAIDAMVAVVDTWA